MPLVDLRVHAVGQVAADDLADRGDAILSVSVLPPSCFRKRCWFECTRPPKSKFGPAKKLRSFSEKMPNWNTGMPTVCISRRMRTSASPAVRAVTSIV